MKGDTTKLRPGCHPPMIKAVAVCITKTPSSKEKKLKTFLGRYQSLSKSGLLYENYRS